MTETDSLRHNVEIMNPLNEDQKIMRRSLLPGLLKVAAKNHSRRNQDLFLFEQGAIFIPGTEELPQEDQCLGVLATGKAAGNWLGEGEAYDFFFMKGVWEALCQVYGIKHWRMEAVQEVPYLHPGRAARIYVDDTEVGFLGELHPLVAKEYDLMQKAVVMQINLQTLYPFVKVLPEYHSLPKFPASERDIAITVNRSIPVAEIEQVIREFGGKYLLQVSLFDVYESEQIGKENRSLAYRLTFQCEERTLTDEEVNEAFQAIVDHLAERFEAKLR